MSKKLAAAVLVAMGMVVLAPPGRLCAEGGTITEARVVAEFTEIVLEGAFEVNVRMAEKRSVRVTTDPAQIARVETSVSNGVLKVTMNDVSLDSGTVHVDIEVPTVTRLVVSGAARIEGTGLEGDRLQVEHAGAATIKLAGEVTEVTYEMSGAGQLEAKDLKAKNVKIRLSGAATAEVHATENLAAVISGAGTIRYAGKPPNVTQEIAGVGHLEAM